MTTPNATDTDVADTDVHRPSYIYCPDPETCCETWGPVAIVCSADGDRWPCETKRGHHTEAHIARIERWVEDRLGRLPHPSHGKQP